MNHSSFDSPYKIHLKTPLSSVDPSLAGRLQSVQEAKGTQQLLKRQLEQRQQLWRMRQLQQLQKMRQQQY